MVPPRVAGESQPRLLSPRGYQEGHFYSYKSLVWTTYTHPSEQPITAWSAAPGAKAIAGEGASH